MKHAHLHLLIVQLPEDARAPTSTSQKSDYYANSEAKSTKITVTLYHLPSFRLPNVILGGSTAATLSGPQRATEALFKFRKRLVIHQWAPNGLTLC